MFRVFILAFTCLFSSAALSQYEAEFQLLERIAEQVINEHDFELSSKPRAVSVHRTERTPVAATTTKSGQCLVILNTNPAAWPNWGSFFKSGSLSKEEVFGFAVLHEIGHCVNKASSLPLTPGIDSESFADAYAFTRLQRVLSSEDFLRHLDAVIVARKSMGFASFFSGHNTSKTLELIRADFSGKLAQAQRVGGP